VPNSLRPGGIQYHLRNYPDPNFPNILISIAKHGARIGFLGEAKQTQRPNHASIHQHSQVIDDYITKEIAAGRIKEISSLPSNFFCSPLGLVPKKHDGHQTGWRLIFDLSCPQGQSVNDGIPKEFGALQYESFQHALQLVARAGRNCTLLKKDLKSAFRHIPISPSDWHLFIFQWRGKYYIDMFLAFGLRTSPRIYNMFGEAIHWVMENEFGWTITHYVDDFLAAFPPNTNAHEQSLLFNKVCTDIGFTTEPKKDEMGTSVNHLGFIIDSSSMTATLPENKRNRATNLLTSMLQRKSVSVVMLESLLGFLSHCCEVVPVGRPFLRNIFNMLNQAKNANRETNPYRYIKVTKHARRDILWWLVFLRYWSRVTIIQETRKVFHVWTDASGKKGIGGHYNTHLFASHVPRRHRHKHINWKEMFAVLHALFLWHKHWENGKLIVHCDNRAVVDAINKKSIRGPTVNPLQTLLLLTALLNIDIVAIWIPTTENAVADALSRHDFKRLANLGYKDYVVHGTTAKVRASTLRQKLFSYFEIASPLQHGKVTPKQSTITNTSQNQKATSHSPALSKPSPTGSLTSSPTSKSTQRGITSMLSATTTSNMACPSNHSMTQSSTACYVAESDYTINPRGSDSLLPKTFSSESPIISRRTSMASMTSISTRPSVSALRDSFALASLRGKNGMLFNLLDSVFHANT